ncbi:hypothetical protein J2X36_003222 [Methylobacterium sp. BE186]|uniref:hypothetical protein n=1 Tax=Methylobacterium sp. BE186 TaxID=2817715 RepID=UPI00286633F7|nr:hypothetical protein [Methylobacterium sp. BE186]MDR7038458.1 hypothetical protein [Methylobacterium sp. BE186]
MANSQPEEVQPSEAEWIAFAYHSATQDDLWAALMRAIEAAVADLAGADRRLEQERSLISHGYVRAQLGPR